MTFSFEEFMQESNEIGGIASASIGYAKFTRECEALEVFVENSMIQVSDLIRLAEVFEPSAKIQVNPTFGGNHRPPVEGQYIVPTLHDILGMLDIAGRGAPSPYTVYCFYETLRPLPAVNGRTGRALWLWVMHRRPSGLANVVDSSFLKTFHYQALDHYREYRK